MTSPFLLCRVLSSPNSFWIPSPECPQSRTKINSLGILGIEWCFLPSLGVSPGPKLLLVSSCRPGHPAVRGQVGALLKRIWCFSCGAWHSSWNDELWPRWTAHQAGRCRPCGYFNVKVVSGLGLLLWSMDNIQKTPAVLFCWLLLVDALKVLNMLWKHGSKMRAGQFYLKKNWRQFLQLQSLQLCRETAVVWEMTVIIVTFALSRTGV